MGMRCSFGHPAWLIPRPGLFFERLVLICKCSTLSNEVLVVLPVLLVRVPVAPRVATDVTPLASHDDET